MPRTYSMECASYRSNAHGDWLPTVFPSKSVNPVTQFFALVPLCDHQFASAWTTNEIFGTNCKKISK
jgi:hypothetical protein